MTGKRSLMPKINKRNISKRDEKLCSIIKKKIGIGVKKDLPLLVIRRIRK
jgi:hypothetical protein